MVHVRRDWGASAPILVCVLVGFIFILEFFFLIKKHKIHANNGVFIQSLTNAPHWGSPRYSAPPLFYFFTASPNCVNDIWQKFPCAGSVARKVLASLYQSIWLMFPCLELPLDGNLLWASFANWNQISSTAWCDIDPYSTPRLPIDQYWFTIKNTPLLVQHCDRYFKAKGKKKLERRGEKGFCFFFLFFLPHSDQLQYIQTCEGMLHFIRTLTVSLSDRTLTTPATSDHIGSEQWSSPAMWDKPIKMV